MEFDPTAFEQYLLDSNLDEEEGSGLGTDGDNSGNSPGSLTRIRFNQCVIVVIDCHSSNLFESVELEADLSALLQTESAHRWTTPWIEVMTAITEYIKTQIIVNENDKFSLILFGTSTSHNLLNIGGIHSVIDLDLLDVRTIEKLMSLSNCSESQINQSYGVFDKSSPFNFSDLFWLCNQVFMSNLSKNYQNRLLLFTAADDPVFPSNDERMISIQRAKDLKANLAEFDIYPLIFKSDQHFDFNKYYVNIITKSVLDPEDSEFCDETNSKYVTGIKLSNLKHELRTKSYNQRTFARLNFVIGDGITVAVEAYTSILTAQIQPPIFLHSKDNAKLNFESRFLCNDTGSLLGHDQMKKYHELGNAKVYVDNEDRYNACSWATNQGLTLLGFKPVSTLRFDHIYTHPLFLYPNDSVPYGVKGSSKLLHALIKSMHRKGVIALVLSCLRKLSAPRLAALLPQIEKRDPYGRQLQPPGLILIFLPYRQDIRNLDLSMSQMHGDSDVLRNCEAFKQGVDLASLFLQQMTIPEENEKEVWDIENPVIAHHYKFLEALALSHSDSPKYEEPGLGLEESATHILTPIIERFEQHLSGIVSPRTSNDSKKKSVSRTTLSSSSVVSDEEIINLAKTGKLNKQLTRNQMKAWLTSKDLPSAGLKADLADKIQRHLQKSSLI